METRLPSMPGYRLHEYLLVISPNESMRSRINTIRQEFNTAFKPSIPLTGRPHIALVRFVAWQMMEEKLVNRFHHIAMGVTPFSIELNNFGSFPTHSIFLNVTTRAGIQNLVKELRTTQKMMKADPDHDPLFIAEPVVAIARKLLPWQYEKGWTEYSQKQFSGKIMADCMLLLKRAKGERGYQITQRFDFLNMPVATKQGELFF